MARRPISASVRPKTLATSRTADLAAAQRVFRSPELYKVGVAGAPVSIVSILATAAAPTITTAIGLTATVRISWSTFGTSAFRTSSVNCDPLTLPASIISAALIVANDVSAAGAGFGVDTNRVTLIAANGEAETLPLQSKAPRIGEPP